MEPGLQRGYLQSYCDAFNSTVDSLLGQEGPGHHRTPDWVAARCSRLQPWGLSFWLFITLPMLVGEKVLEQITEEMLQSGAEEDRVVELLGGAGGGVWAGVRRLLEMVRVRTAEHSEGWGTAEDRRSNTENPWSPSDACDLQRKR